MGNDFFGSRITGMGRGKDGRGWLAELPNSDLAAGVVCTIRIPISWRQGFKTFLFIVMNKKVTL